MNDDPRLYRFLSNLLGLVDPVTPAHKLHSTIHEQLRLALPQGSIDAFVIVPHDPVINWICFACFEAPPGFHVPPDRSMYAYGGIYDWVIINKRSRLWSADAPDAEIPSP